jgi:hypothetical protein
VETRKHVFRGERGPWPPNFGSRQEKGAWGWAPPNIWQQKHTANWIGRKSPQITPNRRKSPQLIPKSPRHKNGFTWRIA